MTVSDLQREHTCYKFRRLSCIAHSDDSIDVEWRPDAPLSDYGTLWVGDRATGYEVYKGGVLRRHSEADWLKLGHFHARFIECNYCSEIALPEDGGECCECGTPQYF